jgi:hypothetical protein
VTRYRWRLALVLLTALTLSTGLVITAGATVAAGPGTFDKIGDQHWRDPNCGSDSPFNVRLFADVDYGYPRWDMCSAWTDFCHVPLGADSAAALLCRSFGIDDSTANDRVSSVRVMAVRGGESCRVVISVNPNHTGGGWTIYDPRDIPNAFPYADTLSSIRREC